MQTTYLKDTDLAQMFGVSRASIWRWVKNNQFPSPVRFSSCCTRWNLTDVQKWQDARTGGNAQ